MSFSESIKEVGSNLENYTNAKLEEIELKAVEKAVHVSASALGWYFVGLLSSLCFGFLMVLLIFWLETFTNSFLTSTLIVTSGFTCILLLVLLFYKKLIYNPIKNLLYGLYFEAK
jgi:ABC-type proline/glycine betaine transport system permease subunit